MPKLLLPTLCAAVLALTLGACAHGKPKSTAHMYSEGDAPTINDSNKQETAGGYVRTY